MNNGWKMYMYNESLSPNEDKIFAFACFLDWNSRNNDIARNVELI